MLVTCITCGKTERRDGRGSPKFCGACGLQQLNDSWRCSRMVNRAVARGELKPASACACVDCGKPAICYDHRDYTKPLDVVPVCGRCNQQRGPALNSRTQSVQSGVVGADPSASEVLSLHGFKHAQSSYSTPLI